MSRYPLALLAVLCLPSPAHAESVPDPELVASANQACATSDFRGFFELFAMSPALQTAFIAPRIEIRDLAEPSRLVRTIDRAAYKGAFNIAMADYYWVDAKSVDGPGYVHLKTEWKELRDGAWRIDYVKAEYDGQGEGDDPGNLVRTFGDPGAYVFERRNGCWQLTQDLR